MSFKSIYVILVACLCFCGIAQGEEFTGYHFSIYKQRFAMADFFNIKSDDTYRGVVKKSAFRVRTNYDLSDEHGWQASGIKRVVSLGSLYPWATEVDLYDTQWTYMGMIDGQAITTAAARFSIYDAADTLVGIAYLDHDLSTYTIAYPDSEAFPIVEMHRHKDNTYVDYWDVTVYDPEQIDERVIRIFAAMVSDIHYDIEKYHRSVKVDLDYDF